MNLDDWTKSDAYDAGYKAGMERAADIAETHKCDNGCADRGAGNNCDYVIANAIRREKMADVGLDLYLELMTKLSKEIEK